MIVVASDEGIGRAADGIPGVKVVSVNNLSVLDLAPAGVAGRLTLWSESSIEALKSKEKEVEMKVEA